MENNDEKVDGGATLWARQTIESDIFCSKPAEWFKIWFYIICKTNYKEKKKFKRGECFLKYEWIMNTCNVTKNQVDHCIRWLKKEQMLATRKATRGFFVKALNYNKFQSISTYKYITKSDTESDLKATQKRHRSDTKTNKDNNDKKEKNIKDNENTLSSCLEKFSEIDIKLTQLLIDLMLENYPESSVKRLTTKRQAKWINECRLLREKDKRTSEQIEYIIKFSQKDKFWKGVILSMANLRKNWDKLVLRAMPKNYSSGIDEWLKEKTEEENG